MPSNYFDWTPKKLAELRRLWIEEGMSAGYIAKLWGTVTRNAIIGKVHRQGWQRSHEPSAPGRYAPSASPRFRLKVGEGDQRDRGLDREPRRRARSAPSGVPDVVEVRRVRKRERTLVQVAAELGITVAELKERRKARRERRLAPEGMAPAAKSGWRVPLAPAAPRVGPVSLLHLAADDCRWIIGEVKGPATLFCGAPKVAGSYCAEHARAALRKTREAA